MLQLENDPFKDGVSDVLGASMKEQFLAVTLPP
jgi:hypothetical protein